MELYELRKIGELSIQELINYIPFYEYTFYILIVLSITLLVVYITLGKEYRNSVSKFVLLSTITMWVAFSGVVTEVGHMFNSSDYRYEGEYYVKGEVQTIGDFKDGSVEDKGNYKVLELKTNQEMGEEILRVVVLEPKDKVKEGDVVRIHTEPKLHSKKDKLKLSYEDMVNSVSEGTWDASIKFK